MALRIIKNEGSAARDHLANERTFLAWLRTALGLVGLGVVLSRLELERPERGEAAGLVLAAFGALCLFYALVRYARIARLLEEGSFPVARRGPIIVGAAGLLLALASVVYLMG